MDNNVIIDHIGSIEGSIDEAGKSVERCKRKTGEVASIASDVNGKIAEIKRRIRNNGNGSLDESE